MPSSILSSPTALARYNPEVRRLVSPADWRAIESSRGPGRGEGLDPDAERRARLPAAEP